MAYAMLIKTIIMVLISIDPFALRKIFLVLGALLCFSAFCFADPVLMTQRYASPELDANAFTELKRVDLPSRGQELLPSSSDITGSPRQPKLLSLDSERLVERFA